REALQHWFPGVPVVCIAPGQDPANHPKAATTHAGRSLRLGSLGRLDSHTKGLDLLLEGLARFVQGGGAAHWTLAGDGPDRQALQGQVERLGLSKHVTFAGEIYGAQKQEFFQELDLYVQVSRHEGLPGAPLEAAAQGIPLLVSTHTHLGPAVHEHQAGIVLEDVHPGSIAAALESLAAQSDEAWTRQGLGAYAMIQSEFAWSSRTQAMRQALYGLPPRSEVVRIAA
ncbi:MAG TPA: glycosyltransferase family 4 protein, partial [Planctomycetota bacterium]|nr:glycosyltransferase family 4 protein [Planctomycetota bacterium]